ncbi:coiled-coil domain-containing protein 57 [Lampris incognitus]|uniref:coiled-coil domain-containing protein 57 n=1 Tax=Lampris incognitus TaxID=2546036 RepID=UPI0024B5048C|nr:coiled-coil domain-containing protein 57 [Lampris incognitus]
MQPVVDNVPGDLQTQLAIKEREWKELQSLRVQQLESSLKEAQDQLSSLRQRFWQLREDFQFNLTVLEERDRELERYDTMAAKAQTEGRARQEELCQLRIMVAKLEEQRDREAKEREEELRCCQQRAAEHRMQLETLQSSMTGDIQKQREEYEQIKQDLQRRIREVEEELALQRQEMTADFENELRLREHEFNLRMDEMHTVVLSHELKVKLLSKETEVHSQVHLQAVEALKASEDLCQQAQTQLQHKDWEVKDITAVKDNRIMELEDELKRMETKLKKEEENHIKKHEDLDRALRQRDAQLMAQRQAKTKQLQKAEKDMAKLQECADLMAAQTRKIQKDHQEELTHRDERIERLCREVETTRSGWDKYINQTSKETVAKDTELLALQEREAKLRTELEKSRGETERHKQQVCTGLEREKALDQRCVQIALEWQRRCEDAKAEHYLASEKLIQGLTQARDQAQAELKERDREVNDLTVLLRTITPERDQALQDLRPSASNLASEEISRLQQQNSSLRAVVSQMRKNMEDLSQLQKQAQPQVSSTQLLQPSATPAARTPLQMATVTPAQPTYDFSKTSPAGTPEYTQALVQEVSELKAQCRHLNEQLEGARSLNTATSTDKVAVALAPVAPDNAYLQNHIRSLNETIGGLRVVKVANTAALKKQEVRVAHLESAVAALTQQCHAKQVEAEELRLELANQKRMCTSEKAGLRQRLTAVEMELEEVRREKEEYQKGNILNNLETVALGNQVSALKLDIASRREPIVCEQSEMVRQLQEENLYLRQQQLAMNLKSGSWSGGVQAGKSSTPLTAPLLQAKLKLAARCITRLTRDKQQLIELGNRLRAQLAATGLDVLQPSVKPGESLEPEKDKAGDQHGHLSFLEQLQYQLTTQELQFAQRERRQGAPSEVRTFPSKTNGGDRNKDRAANPWAQAHKDTARHEHLRIKENIPPLLSKSQSSLHLDKDSQPPPTASGSLLSSVVTDGSLREVWQILDRGLSPSLLTEGEVELSRQHVAEPRGLSVQKGVQGVKICMQSKSPLQERGRLTNICPQPAKSQKPQALRRVSKIRNYNIKD